MSGRKSGLSGSDRAALTSLVQRQRQSEEARAIPRAKLSGAQLNGGAAVEISDALTDFSTLQGYREMELQRAFVDGIGLKSPFFHVHEARAAATTVIGGVAQDNFSSYDYLGFNGHPAVVGAATEAMARFGTSTSASRLVAGERPFHHAFEADLARHYGTEDCLTFVSGYATNVGAISALMGPRDLIVHDALIHNSVLAGAIQSGAERRFFPHNDIPALDQLLTRLRPQYERVLIVVEGLYSMDGDSPDLAALVELKQRHKAWLMVDDAHGLGVIGARGFGLFELAGTDPRDVDIWMGTLSKTLSGCGGYIAGSKVLVEFLRYQAGAFVYSVGLSPPLAAASHQALKLLHAEPERVARLQANGALFLEAARAAGFDTGTSAGYAVVPLVLGDSLLAVALSQRLAAKGINVQPIIHPAVQERAARLRFFITATHTEAQLTRAVEVARRELDHLGSSRAILARPALLGE